MAIAIGRRESRATAHGYSYAGSFAPGGFVTVDKSPLGFWIQTAFARLFGFHGWSILLPEALAGVGSVALLFFLVRRVFGSLAGLLAALALALTPVSVAVNRNNTIDSLLVLTVPSHPFPTNTYYLCTAQAL